MMARKKEYVTLADGTTVSGQMPVTVSASHSTCIPAFYGRRIMERVKAGYVKWFNPFKGLPLYVEPSRVRLDCRSGMPQ